MRGRGRCARRRIGPCRSPWHARRRDSPPCRSALLSSVSPVARRLAKGAEDRAPGQLDLEGVVAKALGLTEQGAGDFLKSFPTGFAPAQQLLRLPVTPRLVRHAAERN